MKSKHPLFPFLLFIVIAGCNILDTPTPADTTSIPWNKLSGIISFVNYDDFKDATKKHLCIINANTQSYSQVRTSTEYFIDATISSYGDYIAYNDIEKLNKLNLINGDIVSFSDSYTPSFTRHNELVYFYAPYGTKEVRKNGNKMNFPLYPSSRIAFGPNDEFYVYATLKSKSAPLVKYISRDSTYLFLTNDSQGDTLTQATNPAISPDGRTVLYTKSFDKKRWSEIWSVNIDGTNDHRILSRKESDFDYPCWSPDGKCFIYSYSYDPESPYMGYAVNDYIYLYDFAKDTSEKVININGAYPSWTK